MLLRKRSPCIATRESPYPPRLEKARAAAQTQPKVKEIKVHHLNKKMVKRLRIRLAMQGT